MILDDFPETLAEFMDKFGSNEACREYLIQQRWPDGFKCPRCGHDKATHLKKYDRWTCRKCLHQTTLIAETALRGTHKALKTWFLGMYLVSTSKGGISAFELKRQLGLGSYQTAWTWLKKLRAAMVDPARKPLEGEVEVDESYVGGKEKGVRGRLTKKKAIVACAVEHTEKGFGRIRLQFVADVTQATLEAFVNDHVKGGATTITDGWKGYNSLGKVGFNHIQTVISKSEASASQVLPGVHRVFSLLKRWLLGTHQGVVSVKHLQSYLDEFTFRFNRRKSHSFTHIFQRLAEGTVRSAAKPYWKLIGRIAPEIPLKAAA